MPEKTLLVGNGPNRVGAERHGWKDVLAELAAFSGQAAVMQGADSKPFTLLFEEIALRCARRGMGELTLKNEVAARLKLLDPNPAHAALMGLGCRHVLTTNYDYTLERASEAPMNCVDLATESRYSLFRCRESGRTRVWHIHGEQGKPATIVLGHDHYVGYLHKAKTYLTPEHQRKRSGNYDYRSPVVHRRYAVEDYPEPYSWIDIFLRDHVHIVGFGFDYSEIALWWLVGYKERLRLQDERAPKGVEVGHTFYYYFTEDRADPAVAARIDVLHDLGVRTVPVSHDGDYLRGYQRIAGAVRRAT